MALGSRGRGGIGWSSRSIGGSRRRRKIPSYRCLAISVLVSIVSWNGCFTFFVSWDTTDTEAGTEYATGATGASSPVTPFDFPSREERVKYYMGDWYDVAGWNGTAWDLSSLCRDVPYYDPEVFGGRAPDVAFLFDSTNVRSIGWGMRFYRRDVRKHLFPSPSPWGRRFIVSLGDGHPSLQYPVIMKSRAANNTAREKGMMSPVLIMLNTMRHYFGVHKVRWLQRLGLDPPWHSKADRLVWRGGRTGGREALVRRFLSDHNATRGADGVPRTAGLGIPMDVAFAPKVGTAWLLRSKYLLSLEGNDVATGLKWMLYGGSAVFMPRPRCVTWAMEDVLEPWVHYVPVADDLSDLPARLEWAHRNEGAVRAISRRATLYMQNLYASPGAQRDNAWIVQEIVRRYQEQFGEELKKCPPLP